MSKSPRRSRRRRTGSTSRRYQPSQLVAVDTQPWVSRETILIGLAVAIVAAALITLIWMMATRAANDYRVQQREEVERGLSAQAATLAEKVKLEMALVDQSLTILQSAWTKDPQGFNLADWHKQVPALTAVSDDIFIADDRRIIQQDILPQAVGQGIGGAYLPFSYGSLELFGPDGGRQRETRIITPTPNANIEARRYLMYIIRPLGDPPRLMIGASYRSGELTRHLADAQLGTNGFVGLMDQRQGVMQSIAGPAARRPRNNVSRSDMYEAMKKGEAGTWIGTTPIDNVARIHGWAKVPTRDSVVIVGSTVNQALQPGEELADATLSIAALATGVVLAVGGVMTWSIASIRSNRRRQRVLDRTRANLTAAQNDLAQNRLRAASAAMQLRTVLDGVNEAAAIFDPEMRLVQWNDRFQLVSGLSETIVQEGLPLDEMLRQQCHAGLFGQSQDAEAEIARRAQTLMVPDPTLPPLTQTGPQGTPIPVLSRRMPDNGLVVILGGLTEWQPPPRPAQPQAAAPTAAPAPEPAATDATVEW